MKRYLALFSIIGFVAVTFAQSLLYAPPVKASMYGLTDSVGYYNHQYFGGQLGGLMDGVSPDWMNRDMTVDKFISNMWIKLNEPTNFEDQNMAVSAIVLTMMGVQSTDPRLYQATAQRYSVDIDGVPITDNRYNQGPYPENYKNGVGLAHYLFPLWSRILHAYDAGAIPGASVNWNANAYCLPAIQDGFGVRPLNPGDPAVNDFAFSNINAACDDMIIFNHSDGTQYMIKKNCGNMTGDETGFPPSEQSQFGVDLTLSTATPNVLPGQTVTIDIGLHNTSATTPVPAGTLEVYRPGGSVNVPCAPGNCPLFAPAQTDLNDGGYLVSNTHGYRPAATIPSQNGQNWYWATNPLPGATNASGSFQVTIAVGAGAGPLSIPACFNPANAVGGSLCTSVILNVAALRAPTIQAQNGDVHAGGHVAVGGSCTQFGGSADVRANPGSYGDYIISASGTISASPSSNGSGGGTTLKLGSTGGYAEICRPDLLAAAQAYTGTITPIIGSSFTLNGQAGVYEYTGGGTLFISGTIKNKVTIISTSGTVQFDSNLTIDPSINVLARNLPSLGVIAAGDIVVSSAVTQLDAFLFSSTGTIDTCYQANSSCSNSLLVNGFLMARDITFARLGAFNTSGAQLGERIALSPQLYLNPPALFDGVVTNVSLSSQGEKQPLY